jgi:hypothetical protein
VKFFIDENLPHVLTQPLNALFLGHEFRSCDDEGFSGVKDIPLFHKIHDRGFCAIITSDSNQVVRNDDERRALHDNKIHWIGVKQPAAKGLHLLATWNANITAAMPHILAAVTCEETVPSYFATLGVAIEAGQRVRVGPLWLDKWS